MSTNHPVDRAAAILHAAVKRLRLALPVIVAAAVTACGGDSTNLQPQSCDDCGTALLTVTDAAGDYLGYSVDLTSLRLVRANGTTVQTLPASTRIDFTQLVDLSEVLSARQVPAGEYVAATLGVDFSDAEIIVDDGTGTGVQVTPVDAEGHALGQVELDVQLDNRRHLVIAPGRISHLAFDLDLAASNTLDLGARTVTVSPFILATVQPGQGRQLRARGRVDSVDVAGGSYTINLRPFLQSSGSSGQMVVHTTATTRFEIDGALHAGADGLEQLAQAGHPLAIAFGGIDSEGVFTAKRVLAAGSAQDLRRDYLSGNVMARSGDTLVVGGVRLGRRGHRQGFEPGRVEVTVGNGTLVTRDGETAGESLDIGDISVGQRIEVFGDFTRDGSGHGHLDATAGRVRMNYTRLFGAVDAGGAGMLTLALQDIDGLAPARLDFSGTGIMPATDADPAHYEVVTGALDVSGLAVGAWTRLSGFVTPFGTAAPDFTADTLLDFTSTRAGLALAWGPGGSTAPFSTGTTEALAVDLAAGVQGAIRLGGTFIDLPALATGLELRPAAGDGATFAIAHRASHGVENFSSFADFAAELVAEIDGTTPVFSIVGEGTFDAGVFSAKRLLVVVGN